MGERKREITYGKTYTACGLLHTCHIHVGAEKTDVALFILIGLHSFKTLLKKASAGFEQNLRGITSVA
jgi:hypothetical protein